MQFGQVYGERVEEICLPICFLCIFETYVEVPEYQELITECFEVATPTQSDTPNILIYILGASELRRRNEVATHIQSDTPNIHLYLDQES